MTGESDLTERSSPIVIDGHQDLAYSTIVCDRDIRQSALATRRKEIGGPVPRVNGQCMIGLPELLEGRVAVVFGTVYAMPARSST